MAYQRRQLGHRASSFRGEVGGPDIRRAPYPHLPYESSSSSSASSLAAKAIRASSAYRDASLSSAYGHSTLSPSRDPSHAPFSRSGPSPLPKDSATHEYNSMKTLDEQKHGFWGTLARKTKAIIEDDNAAPQFETLVRTRFQMPNAPTRGQEGLNIVENRTADIIQETWKLQIRKQGSSSERQKQMLNIGVRQRPPMQTQMHADLEIQLKASRDVAMAMAAKAKLLLRELKTVKADLAFAKERCAQLEEENRILRESLEKGDNPEDDDLIRLQLETLLAEKARLAQENSVFARENRFLREIVEYHQLTMQDVVYLDEGSEEVTEIYPIKVSPLNKMHSAGATQDYFSVSFPTPEVQHTLSHDVSSLPITSRPQLSQDVLSIPSQERLEISPSLTPLSSFIHIPEEEPLKISPHLS
ncbi:uncharacterized protein LOC127809991 [Diospyros lotus]|uniref:uncharacterized protein LOC127809991 n=1 Tax=Diospyros lotus TaxID=55363 RepID=UPI002259E1A7|nr:uncharacterized protein LOC127809991 [Diospyros lotus]